MTTATRARIARVIQLVKNAISSGSPLVPYNSISSIALEMPKPAAT